MKARLGPGILTACLVLIIGSTVANASSNDPRDTVLAFNAAFQGEDKDALIATLAQGGAQFTLRSQHEDLPPGQLQSEISGYWSVIAPVLFASTSSYRRQVEILDSHADGDLATVWARILTRSIRLGTTEPDLNEFTEVYLLIRNPDGWKIAAIADNRQGTKLTDD